MHWRKCVDWLISSMLIIEESSTKVLLLLLFTRRNHTWGVGYRSASTERPCAHRLAYAPVGQPRFCRGERWFVRQKAPIRSFRMQHIFRQKLASRLITVYRLVWITFVLGITGVCLQSIFGRLFARVCWSVSLFVSFFLSASKRIYLAVFGKRHSVYSLL